MRKGWCDELPCYVKVKVSVRWERKGTDEMEGGGVKWQRKENKMKEVK